MHAIIDTCIKRARLVARFLCQPPPLPTPPGTNRARPGCATEVGISGLWLGSQVSVTEPACIGRSSIRPCGLHEGQPTKPTPAASSSYSTYSSPLSHRHLDLVVAPHQNEPHAHQPRAHLPLPRLGRPRRPRRPQPPSPAQAPRWSPRRHARQVLRRFPPACQRLVCPDDVDLCMDRPPAAPLLPPNATSRALRYPKKSK